MNGHQAHGKGHGNYQLTFKFHFKVYLLGKPQPSQADPIIHPFRGLHLCPIYSRCGEILNPDCYSGHPANAHAQPVVVVTAAAVVVSAVVITVAAVVVPVHVAKIVDAVVVPAVVVTVAAVVVPAVIAQQTAHAAQTRAATAVA
jgi:hypothetical protein